MFEIIMVSHGDYAKAMLGSAEMIIGEQDHITTFGLHPGEDVDMLREQVYNAIAKAKENLDVLVLTDMVSGSPFNVTAAAMAEIEFQHIAGVNLPTLLEILSVREFSTVEELCKNIVDQGKSTIVDVNELMKEVRE